MDKIKTFFRYVKRQQFWLICVVIVALGIASWWQFTSTLKAEKKKNLAAIKQSESTAQAVRQVAAVEGIDGHPNQIWEDKLGQYMEITRNEVIIAWNLKDEMQAGTLVWPKELKDDFIRRVQQMRPIEAKVPYPVDRDKELKGHLLERYAAYIELELPKLAQIIKAHWAPAAPTGGGRGGYAGDRFGDEAYGGMEMGGMEFSGDDGYGDEGMYRGGRGGRGSGTRRNDGILVDWNPGNQGELLIGHFDWSNTTSKLPNTLQVLYAQEDYWVLKALMDVIAKTNEGATGRHNVKIRQIHFLHIGKDVGPSVGTISDVDVGIAAGTEGAGEEGAYGEDGGFEGGMRGEMMMEGEYSDESYGRDSYGDEGYGDDGGMFGMGGEFSGGATVMPDPAEKRYVNKDYQPLPGQELRDAMISTDPEVAYLAVAKRMPVRMRFQMDQRAIPELLLACGNSPLTIEVRQVRVYRDPAEMANSSRGSLRGSGGFGRTDGYAGGERGMMGGFDGEMGGGGFMFGRGNEVGSAMKLPTGFDVAVEVYGIIYIYNPVDRSKLGVEEGEEGDQAFSDDEVAMRRPIAR